MKLCNVCVYCGSRSGQRSDYVAAARALANVLVDRDIGLVYGGASIGVMAAVADAVLARGGRVIGVIPQALLREEIAHAGLTELHVVGSMHERKAMMAEASDAFIALPGGIGTLEELFEIWTWTQLGLHDKPCGLLNVAGYFDRLIEFLDHSVAEGFLQARHRSILQVGRSPATLLDALQQHALPPSLRPDFKSAEI